MAADAESVAESAPPIDLASQDSSTFELPSQVEVSSEPAVVENVADAEAAAALESHEQPSPVEFSPEPAAVESVADAEVAAALESLAPVGGDDVAAAVTSRLPNSLQSSGSEA